MPPSVDKKFCWFPKTAIYILNPGDRVEQPKVYADLTFLVNFIMDFMILWATAKLSQKTVKFGRFTSVAILGGIYGAVNLVPEMSACYSLPAKIAFSIFMVVLAFTPRGVSETKKIFINFYAVSFCMAGATIALSCLGGARTSTLSFYYWCLLGGIICALFLGKYAGKYLSQKIIPALLKYRVEIHFGEKICAGEGFLDTGNNLRDPVTQKPVVVAEYSLLRECFPDDCKTALEKYKDENDLLQALSKSSWANRLRLIPFASIGKKNGIMVGFRCDELVVDPNKINLLYKNQVIGVYLDRLGPLDNYQLLIPAEILTKI